MKSKKFLFNSAIHNSRALFQAWTLRDLIVHRVKYFIILKSGPKP